jgi:FkbM family methyltransferase
MSQKDQTQFGEIFQNILNLRNIADHNPHDARSRFLTFCANNQGMSKSQLFQDLLVLFLTKSKRNGTFVEVGAGDGIFLSNSYLLETTFGWSGILAEPAERWRQDLERNRACKIDHRCVWKETDALIEFNETNQPEFSTINCFSNRDVHGSMRDNGKIYAVKTVTLNDLLAQQNCPKQIDYLSIDTEGAELSILEAFSFNDYNISIITVEHNGIEPDRSRIEDILSSRHFSRVFPEFSYFDDWYVHSSLLGLI